MADTNVPIYKVTLAKENKEENNRVEHLYPKSSSDIIDHQIKDTDEHTTVKKMLDDLEDRIGNLDIDESDFSEYTQEIIDARVSVLDGTTKNSLKTRLTDDFYALKSSNTAYIKAGNGDVYTKFMEGEMNSQSSIMIMMDIEDYDVNEERGNGTENILVLNLNKTSQGINIIKFGYIYREDTISYVYLKIIDDTNWALFIFSSFSADKNFKVRVLSEDINYSCCNYKLLNSIYTITPNEISVPVYEKQDSSSDIIGILPLETIVNAYATTYLYSWFKIIENKSNENDTSILGGYVSYKDIDNNSQIEVTLDRSNDISSLEDGILCKSYCIPVGIIYRHMFGDIPISYTDKDGNNATININTFNTLGSINIGNNNSAYGGNAIGSNNISFSGTAIGGSNTTCGGGSFAIGSMNRTYDNYSMAMGYRNIVSGKYSFACGGYQSDYLNGINFNGANNISGNYSVAFGGANTVSGNNSLTFGIGNTNITNNSFIGGAGNINNAFNGRCGFIYGFRNTSWGTNYTIGYINSVKGTDNITFGKNNTIGNDTMDYITDSTGSYTATINNIVIGDGNVSYGSNGSINLGKSNRTIGNPNNIYYDAGMYPIAIGVSNYTSMPFAGCIGYANESTGLSSFAIGRNNKATAESAVCIGYNNESTVFSSIALGNYNKSNGGSSVCIGYGNKANEGGAISIGGNNTINEDTEYTNLGYAKDLCVAMGYGNTVNKSGAYCIGKNNNCNANDSMTIGWYNDTNSNAARSTNIGYNNTVSGEDSITIGNHLQATANATIAIGYSSEAKGKDAIAIGRDAVSTGEDSIAIGWSRSSALEAVAIGGNCTSKGQQSLAIGNTSSTSESGHYSLSIGLANKAKSTCSTLLGFWNESIRRHSIIIGTGCTDDISKIEIRDNGGLTYHYPDLLMDLDTSEDDYEGYSVAIGNHCFSTADSAVSIGNCIWNNSVGSFICGICPDTWSNSINNSTGGARDSVHVNTKGYAFIVGDGYYLSNPTNGTSIERSNAFRVNCGGNTYAGGSYNSSGADYAEFIKEWYDGNPNNEDRVGYMVTIKNGKLYKANEGDYIIGITSGNPSIIGNADETYYWKYERDKFNRILLEDVEIKETSTDTEGNTITKTTIYKDGKRKLNPNYDPSQPYIERAKRPEWDYVGMRGIVPCRDDGTCEAGGFCKCGIDGIATKADTRGFDTYYVIERIDEETISVEVR